MVLDETDGFACLGSLSIVPFGLEKLQCKSKRILRHKKTVLYDELSVHQSAWQNRGV